MRTYTYSNGTNQIFVTIFDNGADVENEGKAVPFFVATTLGMLAHLRSVWRDAETGEVTVEEAEQCAFAVDTFEDLIQTYCKDSDIEFFDNSNEAIYGVRQGKQFYLLENGVCDRAVIDDIFFE